MYLFLKLISQHTDLQTDKVAHKESEEAHGDATKGHLSQAQGHAKDAAKQTVGAGDAKKEQAKAGHKVCSCSCQRCTDEQGFVGKRVCATRGLELSMMPTRQLLEARRKAQRAPWLLSR